MKKIEHMKRYMKRSFLLLSALLLTCALTASAEVLPGTNHGKIAVGVDKVEMNGSYAGATGAELYIPVTETSHGYLAIAGTATGSTKIVLDDLPDAWDGTPIDLVEATNEGSSANTFTMDVTTAATSGKKAALQSRVENTKRIWYIAESGATLMGTVFPFVHWEDADDFNDLFSITVSLKPLPDPSSEDPVGDLISSTPIQSVNAIVYDGSEFVPNTPKFPGYLGEITNPGLEINWLDAIGREGGSTSTDFLSTGEKPESENGMSIGLFKLEAVPAGTYILEIKREGFLTRFARITVSTDAVQYTSHRELLPGDVDNSFFTDVNDGVELLTNNGPSFGEEGYYPRYDLDANGYVDINDYYLLLKYNGFWFNHYQETADWLNQNFGLRSSNIMKALKMQQLQKIKNK